MSSTKKITIIHPISNYKQVNTKKGVSQYSKYLSNHGHDVELIVYQTDPKESDAINIEGVTVRSIATTRIWKKILITALILIFSQSSLVITQFFGKKDLIWAPICRIKGIKYAIIADHTPHQDKIPKGIYYKTKIKLGILSPLIHTFFVRTADSRDELIFIWPQIESKTQILPSGVDDAYFSINNKTHEANTLIYVGRLIDDKNVEILLEAFNEIKDEYSDWELHIAGIGPKNYDIKDRRRIIFRGFLQEEELLELYSQADILCLPSLHESFSNVLLEAAATQTAVVSTKVGIAPELLEEAGLIIEKNDVSDTKTKLSKYMENTKLREKDAKELREKAKRYKLSELSSEIKELIQ